MIADICSGVCVKKPEWHVDAFDLVNMVLFFENLGKKDLAVKVLVQAFFGSLFVQLKGNYKVWTQYTGEFTGYYYRVAAKRAAGSACAFVRNDLTAAGLAYVDGHFVSFVFLPVCARSIFPGHVIGLLAGGSFIKFLNGFHVEFGVAVRAFHLLKLAVELNGSAAARAFIFKDIGQYFISSRIKIGSVP